MVTILFTQGWADCDFIKTGQIGDTIGGTTAPIIGILSIFLLFYTLWEQIKFNKKQKEISIDEQFKSVFFNLLQVQRDILEKVSGSFTYLGVGVDMEHFRTVEGFDFFKLAKHQLRLIYQALDSEEYFSNYDGERAHYEEEQLEHVLPYYGDISLEEDKRRSELIFEMRKPFQIAHTNDKYQISEKAYKKYKEMSEDKKIGLGYVFFFYQFESVGCYFRHLYHILKFIKKNEDDKISLLEKKSPQESRDGIYEQFKQYAQFIQAQMSAEELLLLFYNCFAFEKIQKLIVYYDLLENLNVQDLMKKEHNCKPELKLKDKHNLFLDLIK
jgi:hypothetical protein